MSTNFRTATSSDIALLRNFESKLVAHERSIESTLIQDGPLEYYDIPKLIDDIENSIIIIAEVDDEPVGCGLGQIRKNEPYNNVPRYGYVGLMYVDETQRGNKIGGSIIQELTKWFHGKNINEIRLKVYANNPMAVKAYEKYGFEHFVCEMKLK